ncbi:MAG: bifunctional homocysteine S-methyltransferase/methylenetetrahydrofolate reductase [Anaerolineales bacterium]
MARHELLEKWFGGGVPILADGAMGTMLHAEGIPFDDCFDELNRSQPDLVARIHRAYIEAGAQLIETNTFGANRYKLSAHGLADQVEGINTAAVDLARRTAEDTGANILIAGSVGPLGVRLAPFGRVSQDEAREVFREQILALVDAGVDLLLVETHSDLYEIREAVHASRDVTSIPVIASATFTRDDRTLLGDTPSHTARFLAQCGADIIGANCSGGPAQLLRILGQMRQAIPGGYFSVMPNAGWPEQISGRIMYPATEDYLADYAIAFCEAGANIIGGCCGTTPAHIANMRESLDSMDGPCEAIEILDVDGPATAGRIQPDQPTELSNHLSRQEFLISVELDPPRGFSTHKLLAGAQNLAEAGADVINVADSPMARMRMSPWAACQIIQKKVGVETVLHFPTRGRNLLRVQGDLLAAHAIGVRNVFVVMGDPTAIGDYPEAMDNFDVVPSGLIRLIKHNFNSGVDHSGADIGEATSFFVGCALNLNPHDIDREIRVLRKKILAGADFALTQPVFAPEHVEKFVARYQEEHGELNIHLIVGVLPIFNARHAAFLCNEVPGIDVPEHIQERIDAAGEGAPAAGVQIAIELIEEMGDSIQGAYIMPAFGRYDLASEIIESVRSRQDAR